MMTEKNLFNNSTSIKENAIENLISTLSPGNSPEHITDSLKNYLKDVDAENECDDTIIRTKKRLQTFSETSSDGEEVQKNINSLHNDNRKQSDQEEHEYSQIKSRNRVILNSDDELQKSSQSAQQSDSMEYKIISKKKKIKEKFDNLKLRQEKKISLESHNEKINFESDNSDKDSYNKIKQIIEEKQTTKLSIICDPDTSEDEDNELRTQRKTIIKSTKLGLPKPVRISAKQAMENMQKIKSESNRMLREKEVSLPYHKPKALSLKDIMSRRKPALAPNGKTLSVKMSAEQLQEYALHLEQRQKEMMELCKSDSDDNLENEKDQDTEKIEQRDVLNIVEYKASEVDNNIDTHASDINKIDVTNNVSSSNDVSAGTINENNPQMFNGASHNEPLNTGEINQNTESYSERILKNDKDVHGDISVINTHNKDDSQIIELHYNSEKTDNVNMDKINKNEIVKASNIGLNDKQTSEINDIDDINKLFSENDISFNEIDELIEQFDQKGYNAYKLENSNTKPQLTGTPGMLIDLDNSTIVDKKLSGVELLKERFKYFAKLKSKEDEEKDREKKYKPGVQHLKLKQELENQIAEQRSLEWAKRLEQETQQQLELKATQEDESDLDYIEKIEEKLQKLNNSCVNNDESDTSEEEIFEDDCVIVDKPRSRNPMIDDEAQESDTEDDFAEDLQNNLDIEKCTENKESDEDSSEDESSESDEETNKNLRKGRILKAFEDSDDEDNQNKNGEINKHGNDNNLDISLHIEREISGSQDEELQLAQVHETTNDIIITQDQIDLLDTSKAENGVACADKALGSQTFSIKDSQNGLKCLNKLVQEVGSFDDNFKSQNLYRDCSQNLDSQYSNNLTESQELGADVAALCTGKFYDNPFVSQTEDPSQLENEVNCSEDTVFNNEANDKNTAQEVVKNEEKILTSILEELDNPQFETPKQYKYFASESSCKENKIERSNANIGVKKKFAIDSDDEVDDENSVKNNKKKTKKRKQEKRALQFSDDEEDFEGEDEGMETFEYIEEDNERVVEYDSEENEVEIQPLKVKKKRVAGDFLEQEAELTSEDEWIGSGDEDEAGLDRMEREEGDDDVFHEGKLRNELGQIHMRDVLDQDKREVRLLQELLFEDGDLGDGHRQRKFRWRNADDIDGDGTILDEFAETQEEEFESEEQWRKQRHEREVFLRKMKGDKDEDINNCSMNRSSIIKANLCSKASTSLISESNANTSDNTEKKNVINDKRNHKDIPSPKKPFPIFQHNHHCSLLSRGKNALARLAAIAKPIAGDGDSTTKVSAPTNRRNFVFAALSQDDEEIKVSKRKADTTAPAPVLTKKMKTEEIPKYLKSSLFDFLET